MRTHREVEERSLELARLIVVRIDADPERAGLEHARRVLERWSRLAPAPDLEVWREILAKPWPEVREVLLDVSERGRRLRQSSPFCGVVSPRERWRVWRRHRTP